MSQVQLFWLEPLPLGVRTEPDVINILWRCDLGIDAETLNRMNENKYHNYSTTLSNSPRLLKTEFIYKK